VQSTAVAAICWRTEAYPPGSPLGTTARFVWLSTTTTLRCQVVSLCNCLQVPLLLPYLFVQLHPLCNPTKIEKLEDGTYSLFYKVRCVRCSACKMASMLASIAA